MFKVIKLLSVMVFLLMFSFSGFAKDYTVERGDTLYNLLSDDFKPAQILNISKTISAKLPDFTLQIGDELVYKDDMIVVKINIAKEIHIIKTDGSFEVVVKKYPVNILRTVVSGTINHSLFFAMKKVGESDILAVRLARILEWEVDFFKDIRIGDQFRVVVEKKFCRDKFIGYGDILALDFVNDGRLVRGLYYENDKISGYFRPNGKSLERGFLKAPLRFGRISSTFQHSRLHPVLNVYRPHHGVDYAAPRGTPVHSTADGKIIKKSYSKGNGYYVKISHMNEYETMYLHFSAFKKGLYNGKFVKQGEVIGYVGSTGLSTGPHVDYRIKKRGRYLNPLKFKSPTKKLPENVMAEFRKSTELYANMLNFSYLRYASGFTDLTSNVF